VRLSNWEPSLVCTTEKVDEKRPSPLARRRFPEQGALQQQSHRVHDLKGAVEQVLARFQTARVLCEIPAETSLTPAWLHPYRSARVVVDGERRVGWPAPSSRAASRKIKEPVAGWRALSQTGFTILPLRKPAAREISRFQPVRRDFSLVLDTKTRWEQVDRALAGLKIPELVDWRVTRGLP